jgi:hypothetical protein
MRQPLRNSPTPLLHNPVAIGGLAAVAAVLVVVLAVVIIGGAASSSDDSDTGAKIAPAAKATTKTQSDDRLDGLTGKATRILNVRSGPDNNYEVLGLLLRGAEVRIVGQSEDGGWLQIEYPVHSNLRGWVIVGSLEVQGDLAGVPVATPESLPLADVPTYEAVPTEWIDVTTTPESAITVTPTSTPSLALPDLVVGGSLVSGGVLIVTVTNQGTGALPGGSIEVAVFDDSGTTILSSSATAVESLDAGASIDIRTGYITFGGPPQVIVIVDPNGKIAESDDTNNQFTVTLGPVETPVATETPHP